MCVAEIGAEGDDVACHSIAVVPTPLQRADGEGVPEIMDAGAALTSFVPYPCRLDQSPEDFIHRVV